MCNKVHEWKDNLERVELFMNSSYNNTTEETPEQIMFNVRTKKKKCIRLFWKR